MKQYIIGKGFSYPCLLGHLTLGYVCKVYISSQIKQLSALITEMAQFFMFNYSQENILSII